MNTAFKKLVTCSIFFHNYYGNHEYWIKLLTERMTLPFTLFYNVVEGSMHNQDEGEELKQKIMAPAKGSLAQKIVMRRSPNQGKDIGGKLVLIDSAIRMQMQTDYQLFLHDKQSQYKIHGQEMER